MITGPDLAYSTTVQRILHSSALGRTPFSVLGPTESVKQTLIFSMLKVVRLHEYLGRRLHRYWFINLAAFEFLSYPKFTFKLYFPVTATCSRHGAPVDIHAWPE